MRNWLYLLPRDRWLLQPVKLQFLQRWHHLLRVLYITARLIHSELSIGQLVRPSMLSKRLGLQFGRKQHVHQRWYIVHEWRQHILQHDGCYVQLLLPQQRYLRHAFDQHAEQQWHLRVWEHLVKQLHRLHLV